MSRRPTQSKEQGRWPKTVVTSRNGQRRPQWTAGREVERGMIFCAIVRRKNIGALRGFTSVVAEIAMVLSERPPSRRPPLVGRLKRNVVICAQSLFALSAAASSALAVEPGRQSERREFFRPAANLQLSRRDMFPGRTGPLETGSGRAGSSPYGRRRPARRRTKKAARRQRSGRCRPELDASARGQCSLVGAARALCRDRNRVVDASRASGRDDLVGFNALVPLDKIRSSPIFVF